MWCVLINNLPERYDPWKAVHTRFSRSAAKGVWEAIFAQLAEGADNEYASIDSTIVRTHKHSAGLKNDVTSDAIGRSRGGWSTRKPVAFADLAGADVLLPQLIYLVASMIWLN